TSINVIMGPGSLRHRPDERTPSGVFPLDEQDRCPSFAFYVRAVDAVIGHLLELRLRSPHSTGISSSRKLFGRGRILVGSCTSGVMYLHARFDCPEGWWLQCDRSFSLDAVIRKGLDAKCPGSPDNVVDTAIQTSCGHGTRITKAAVKSGKWVKAQIKPMVLQMAVLLGSGQSSGSTDLAPGVAMEQGSPKRMGFFGQVWLLLWKIMLQQRRSVKVTVAEILMPLLGAAIMLAVRQQGGWVSLQKDDLITWYRLDSNDSALFPFGVVFENMETATTLPSQVTYKLRLAQGTRTSGERVYGLLFLPVYYNQSFIYTQRIIDEALIRQWAPSAAQNLGVDKWALQRIPFPPYINDAMTQEKELQLKESMKLMGLSAAAHWTAWFVQFFIYLVVVCIIYTLFMSIGVGGKQAVLVFSDPSVVLVFLLLYSVCIISYCFFVSTLVNKANVGAAVAGILFFAIFFPFYFLEPRYEELTIQDKLAACVLFNMAMSYGMKTIGLYEGTGKGAQWDSFTKPASVDDNFSLLHAMVMLIIDTVIFFILTWYIDNVHPGAYGVPRPWYFPFQASYWCGGGQDGASSGDRSGNSTADAHFEREPTGLPVGIRMVHLRKVFAKNKVAVKDSTLTMYEGQITVLLGHNGAGKTTTMSMLTGFLPPTSGTAYVNGYDIRTDINSVRNNLGLCPQHNILFATLTVDEHLTFFARLKGCPKKDVPRAVEVMAKEVGLESKRKAYAGTLSGGQKRKLSVGIALIGGSKIVVLDEPTSGMDPAARRQTWDVLQRNRAGRTLLLSTHFMDEADLLGDRIAIMAEGVVKCCGTSMFLKKLYGAGYHLIIVKGPNCDVDAVTATVRGEISAAELEAEVGAELSYLLPEDQVSKFPKLFEMIESHEKKLGLTSFGVSATTMEEVFLNGFTEEIDTLSAHSAAENGTAGVKTTASGFTNPNYTDEDKLRSKNPTVSNGGMENGATAINVPDDAATVLSVEDGYQRLTGFNVDLSRFYGMFVKKAIHTFRNRVISAVQLALPVLFTIAALTVDKVQPKDSSEPPRTLTLDMFDGTISSYSAGLSPSVLSQALGANYTTLFSGDDEFREINRTKYQDINQYFLNQSDDVGLFTYLKKVVMGADFEPGNGTSGLAATAWYSGQPYHAMPTALAYLMNALARQVTGDADKQITTVSYPMPKDEVAAAKDSMTQALALGFSIGFSMLFGMSFLTASFSYFLIRERQCGAKHLQVVSGVGPFAFWLASFAWDMVNYLIPCLVLLVVFAAFQVEAYTSDDNMALVFLVLVVFGLAVIPYTYILQFIFVTPATGFVVIIILAIISGLFTMLTVFILRIPSLDLVDVAEILDWIFMVVFPHYCLGMGFSNFYVNDLDLDYCFGQGIDLTLLCPSPMNPCCKDCSGEFCLPWEKSYLAWKYPGIGRNVFFMIVHCIVYFSLTLAIEYQLPQKLAYFCRKGAPVKPIPHAQGTANGGFQGGVERQLSSGSVGEDSDVAEERQRVSEGGAQGDTLVLDSLYKQYGTFLAVNRLCVGVPEQECFGLLGQNGAGKTTTFKMLTGDVMVTSGNAFVRQFSIKTDIKQVQANMGYCPQFDALIDQMTGRETLTMYARLRGVPSSHIKRIVNNLISLLMLEPHADKLTGFYSGGNKRKLSTAIALIGGPAVILLDEPSSGMDPAARRQLWNVLSQVRASGRTLILTSHSMEECDALCTRIAIMVNGDFKCLGSPQHLKSKYGQGYTVIVKMAAMPDGSMAKSQPLEELILSKFPGTQTFDNHQGYVHFQVPDASIPLSQVFATMEHAKSEFHIEDYSVHTDDTRADLSYIHVVLSTLRERFCRDSNGCRWTQGHCCQRKIVSSFGDATFPLYYFYRASDTPGIVPFDTENTRARQWGFYVTRYIKAAHAV
ncbi:hypothetical protein BaRGS_00022219, partial [Batillaria attramentaria]